MSVADWIEANSADQPERLAARIRAVVSAAESARGSERLASTAELLITASGRLLTEVIQSGERDRGSALELLVADALATYAFEAQAGAPEELDARCTWAMGELSRIAETA